LKIGWIIEKAWSELLCAKGAERSGPRTSSRPLVDFIHIVDTKRWRRSLFTHESRQQIATVLSEVRNQLYDVAVDFQGALKSALISRLAKTQEVVGILHPREAPARTFYSSSVETKGAHVIEQYHSLAEGVAGKSLVHSSADFPTDSQSEKTVAGLITSDERFVLMTPGTGWGAKQWPPERYGEVAKALAQDKLTILVNTGPGEQELARAVVNASSGTACAVSCSVSELIALTRRAKLFIGGDTGPLHLAAALHVPVVAIFGPTDPARNGPYGTRCIVLRNAASQTSLSHTSGPDPGLLKISSGEVIAAARHLLEDASA
jgi:heptosyltransferase I